VDCNPEGELIGKWTVGPMHTMTQQSVLLGIPAMQLEIPKSLRILLIKDSTKLRNFANAILSTYQEVIVAEWEKKQTELIVNYSLSRQLVESKLSLDLIGEMAEEYSNWDINCADLLI
jgi:hypothetical protein